SGAFAEEILLALRHPDLLTLVAREIQPVLVHEHLGVLDPGPPRLLRDVLEDLLTELTLERGPFESFCLPAELQAMHGARHDDARLITPAVAHRQRQSATMSFR